MDEQKVYFIDGIKKKKKRIFKDRLEAVFILEGMKRVFWLPAYRLRALGRHFNRRARGRFSIDGPKDVFSDELEDIFFISHPWRLFHRRTIDELEDVFYSRTRECLIFAIENVFYRCSRGHFLHIRARGRLFHRLAWGRQAEEGCHWRSVIGSLE